MQLVQIFYFVLIFNSVLNLCCSRQIVNVEYVSEDYWGLAIYKVEAYNGTDELGFNPEQCFNDSAVQLIECNFETIPLNLFEVFPNITLVVLESCGIKTIRKSDFVNGGLLEELDLSDNNITELPSEVFINLVKLKRLFLSYNLLTELKPDAFSGLSELNELVLKNNKIQQISANTLLELVNLEVLDLDNNQIEIIPEGLFQFNKNLTHIFFSGNGVKKIGTNTFVELKQLQKVLTKENSFEELHLPSVNTINVENGKLRELKIMGTVNMINAENNQLAIIDVEDLSATKFINLKNNKITDVNNLKSAINVTILDLSGNPIGSLPSDVFAEMTNLRILELSNTNLTNFDNVTMFANLESILHLHLINNNFTHLDKELFVLRERHEFNVYLDSDVCNRLDLDSFRDTDAKVICIT